ncbi:MAG: lytic murein transglycosylase [Candidatus Competibacteraceae bacterium]
MMPFLLALFAPATAAAFERCLAQLRQQASGHGVSHATFDRHTRGLAPDRGVVGFLDAQPEFRTPIWDYMAGLVDEERVADGRARFAQWRPTLAAIERQFGVDPAVVVAVWGVETDYGRTVGRRPLVTSLATLSCFGRRQTFFRGELFAALKILEGGHVAPERLVGSWAGAFGHTQFMPSTFRRLAVDFDGDGRRDLMDSVPDALASTANYLRRAGWRTGEAWGVEVVLPAGFNRQADRRNKVAVGEWARRGVRRADGRALSGGDRRAGLILPAGREGPAFLVFRNFDALYSYNPAESYALAIAHLADRIRGGGPFVTPWPTDDPGLSRAERREVQRRLIERGFAVGEVDGILGANTRKAIREWQQSQGMKADGRAGQALLRRLRGGG